MASQPVGENTVLEWSSYVRGHHIYCQTWTPTIGEILSLQNEPDNGHYQFSVAVIKNSSVVDHVPRVISRLIFHFLSRDGHTGSDRKRLNHGANLGVEIPCIYQFYGRQRYVY